MPPCPDSIPFSSTLPHAVFKPLLWSWIPSSLLCRIVGNLTGKESKTTIVTGTQRMHTDTPLSDRQHQLHWVGQSAGRQLSSLWAELLSLYSQEETGRRRKGGNLHESDFPMHPQQQIVNKISHPKPKRKRFGPFLLGHREGFFSCFPVAPGTQTPCHLASLLSASPSPAWFTLGSVFKASGQKGLLNFISCRGVSVPDSAKMLRPE